MCGIAGFISHHATLEASRLDPMLGAQRHRGPDGQGAVTFGSREGGAWTLEQGHRGRAHAALGHVRLAIVDLSANAAQPMCNEDGTLWLTFNGEIYNHALLRRPLQAAGHVFKSQCDAEVLLHGYEQHGTAFFEQLRGMYAFALLHVPTQSLTLCRDPFGIKPLYLAHQDGTVAFASELRALEQGGFTGGLNLSAMHLYAALGFVPAPHTLLQGAHKLAPGAIHVVTAQGSKTVAIRWPPLQLQRRTDHVDPRAPDQTWEVLKESVTAHLMADVEVGTFLSGGIDSALVSAAMVDVAGHNVQAFTMAVDDPALDESVAAAQTARELGLHHRIRRVGVADALARLPALLEGLDEPLGDASVLPTRLLCEFAREHVKVALSGDGGDELFGGYTRHHLLMLMEPWRIVGRTLSPLHALLPTRTEAALNALYARVREPLHWPPLHAPARKLKAALASLGEDRAVAYARMWRVGSPNELEELGVTPDPALAHLQECAHGFSHAHPLALAQTMDGASWLPYDILPKVDGASMAVGLEARVPLLDETVARHAAGLGLAWLHHQGQGKRVLRELVRRRWGDTLSTAGKRGFGLPLRDWLMGPLRAWRQDALGSLGTRGLFPTAGLLNLQAQHDGGLDHAPLLYSLCALEMWLRARPGRAR